MLRLNWPAEWHPQRAIWVGYPHDPALWADQLAAAQDECLDLVVALATGGTVMLVVPTQEYVAELTRHLRPLRVRLHVERTGDIWLRDTAPLFVHDVGGAVVANCFAFNGWGHKYLLPDDRHLSLRLANVCARQGTAAVRPFDFVLEGGAVDTDGAGTVLTSRQCLLNPNRGATWTPVPQPLRQQQVEADLGRALGARQVIWLGDGLSNDHTDGHVDTLARFVAPGEVVCMVPSGADDPNAAVLQEILATLRQARDAAGRRLRVHTVPSPGRVVDAAGALLPASYMNFIVANRCVVVPTYDSPHDAAALAALAPLFAERRVLGRSALAILSGGGAFHCMTQQQPLKRHG